MGRPAPLEIEVDAEYRLACLRIVVDEYVHAEYKLGVRDCVSFIAAYLNRLGVEHNWSDDEALSYRSATPEQAARRMMEELGPRLDKGTSPETGDVAMLENDGLTFAVACGRGWITMMAKDGMVLIPFAAAQPRHIWRP